jgi:SAM-dependent methyltransferase
MEGNHTGKRVSHHGERESYWDRRFSREGRIWGDMPSRTAEYALTRFRERGIRSILVPGAGYGRNTKLFSDNGFEVVGIEISGVACRIARRFDARSTILHSSVLHMEFSKQFDAVYCFNVLHLFLEWERKTLIRSSLQHLKDAGCIFFTVLSEKDESFGRGKAVEPNTFESKPGRPAHYFTRSDLIEHFSDAELLETGIFEEPEDHGGGPHTHILRYIFSQKRKA